jgi:hypothetical protein
VCFCFAKRGDRFGFRRGRARGLVSEDQAPGQDEVLRRPGQAQRRGGRRERSPEASGQDEILRRAGQAPARGQEEERVGERTDLQVEEVQDRSTSLHGQPRQIRAL